MMTIEAHCGLDRHPSDVRSCAEVLSMEASNPLVLLLQIAL
jgi:hypothetical protein